MDQRVFFVFLVVCIYQAYSFYLITDYYMSQSHSTSWGGTCEKKVEDACAFLNSHINNLRINNYKGNRDCWTVLDAGNMIDAKFRIDFKYFQLQDPDINGDCLDYLEFYDGPAINASTFLGRFCGSDTPNVTGITQRYVTVYFKTDNSIAKDGFRIKAVRSEPATCQEDEFHCTHENRCIDGRLKCDGTEQCVDGFDEDDCDAWERFAGSFLALGLGGLIGVGAGCVSGCTTIGVIICCCTCCKNLCCPCIGKGKSAVIDINHKVGNGAAKGKGGGRKKGKGGGRKQRKKKKADDEIRLDDSTGDLRDLAMTPISIN